MIDNARIRDAVSLCCRDVISPSIAKADLSLQAVRQVFVVRDHDQGNLFANIERQQDIFYLFSCFRVKVSCRFIGKNDIRFHDQRPGYGDPLLLPAGELAGFVADAMSEADTFQQCLRPLFGLAARNPVNEGRHHGVFQSAELRQQVVQLKNKTDLPVAKIRQLVGTPGEDIDIVVRTSPEVGWSSAPKM